MIELSVEFVVPKVPLFDGTAQRVVNEEMRAAANTGLLILKGAIIPITPVGVTELLRQGVQTSLAGEGVAMVGRVFDPVPHALPVEDGSKPHWPPRGPIELWVRRKFGITNEKEARSVAFLVARKIARSGTPAVKMFQKGFNAVRGQIVARFETANARIAARLVGKG